MTLEEHVSCRAVALSLPNRKVLYETRRSSVEGVGPWTSKWGGSNT